MATLPCQQAGSSELLPTLSEGSERQGVGVLGVEALPGGEFSSTGSIHHAASSQQTCSCGTPVSRRARSFCPAVCSWEHKLKQPRVHSSHQEPNSAGIGCCRKPGRLRGFEGHARLLQGPQPAEPQPRAPSQSLDWLVFLTGQRSTNPNQV